MTTIQWTDETWNPVTGCTKVSEGCRHCYAERLAPRVFAGQRELLPTPSDGESYGDATPPQHPGDHWSRQRRFTDVRTHPERLDAPLRWRKPRRVFVNSMSDLFHENVPDEFIDEVFAIMALASRHTFQVLTKRPQRMRDYLSKSVRVDPVLGLGRSIDGAAHWSTSTSSTSTPGRPIGLCSFPLPNVWLGVSVEDQWSADKRIPLLLRTPAAVRFLSCEPLLEPIDLYRLPTTTPWHVDWVIVGGESGPKARPCDVAWIRDIVRQCREAGVPCFVKQLGTKPTTVLNDRKGGNPSEWPEDLRVRQFPQEPTT